MLKIGVLGAGHLGKIHLNCIKQIEQYDLVGFFDPDTTTAQQVKVEMGVKSFETIDELIGAVDVVDIVTPTIRHFECASKALQKRKHVFIEKPIVATPDEANALKKLADEAGVKVQWVMWNASIRLSSRLSLSSKARFSLRRIAWLCSTRVAPTCPWCST